VALLHTFTTHLQKKGGTNIASIGLLNQFVLITSGLVNWFGERHKEVRPQFELHWFDVADWVTYKLCMTVHK